MVTNALGCSAWDDIVIQVKCDNSVLFMPNTFTPNGDGNNDTYFPVGRGITAVRKFAIYNRWGQKLYEVHNVPANEITRGWDGVYRGEQLKPDVFVYMVEAECSTGELIVQKGDVSLIR